LFKAPLESFNQERPIEPEPKKTKTKARAKADKENDAKQPRISIFLKKS